MTLTKEQIKEFKRSRSWAEIASKCEHCWQQYHGIPSPIPSCRLTNDACRYENCPKLKEVKK